MNKNQDLTPFIYLPLAILMHGFFLLILKFPTNKVSNKELKLESPIFEIKNYNPKVRTVGIKNGSRTGINMKDQVYSKSTLKQNPTPQMETLTAKKTQAKKSEQQESKEKNDSKNLNTLKELAIDQNGINFRQEKINPMKRFKRKSRFTYQASKKDLSEMVNEDLVDVCQQAQRRLGLIAKSDLAITFEPPEGVDYSELNQLEQIFYGFNIRIYKSFVSSLVSTHSTYLTKNPHVNLSNLSPEKLRAVVRFDQEGNIQHIKMLRWSKDDNIQSIFQNSLEGIKSIPNPPKAFVKNKDHFDLYFNLIIKG